MALINCKECDNEISKKAKTCPQCGAKNKRPSLILQIVFVLFGCTFLANIFSGASNTQNRPNTNVNTISNPTVANNNIAKPLEVSSWSCDKKHGYMFIRGEVKNITDKPIKNLMAVATFRTKDDTFVKSDDALVEYNPLLPGQTSPFKVGTSQNPASEKCRLSFKTMFGSKLRYKDVKNEN